VKSTFPKQKDAILTMSFFMILGIKLMLSWNPVDT